MKQFVRFSNFTRNDDRLVYRINSIMVFVDASTRGDGPALSPRALPAAEETQHESKWVLDPDDPRNPQNWSRLRKYSQLWTISLLTLLS